MEVKFEHGSSSDNKFSVRWPTGRMRNMNCCAKKLELIEWIHTLAKEVSTLERFHKFKFKIEIL